MAKGNEAVEEPAVEEPAVLNLSANQAWGQVHWYLYLSTLKYTLLSTCTCTSVLLFF